MDMKKKIIAVDIFYKYPYGYLWIFMDIYGISIYMDIFIWI